MLEIHERLERYMKFAVPKGTRTEGAGEPEPEASRANHCNISEEAPSVKEYARRREEREDMRRQVHDFRSKRNSLVD